MYGPLSLIIKQKRRIKMGIFDSYLEEEGLSLSLMKKY